MESAEALTDTIAIRLDRESMEALRAVARVSHRAPAALARDWIRDKLAVGRAREPENPTVSTSEPDDSREKLRQHYRPSDIVVLFVGESAPAGGSFFYQADSNLFFATREACAQAFRAVPEGRDFLRWFKAHDFWLYDLVDQPVNRNRGRPRKLAVSAGMSKLAEVIQEAEPDFVVAVKTSIEADVRQAAERAGFPGNRIVVLPFPLYQWREVFVRELARFLGHRRAKSGGSKAPRRPANVDGISSRMLHEAMAKVLEGAGGGPQPARELANEIATQELYFRQDGGRADYQQVLARARKYPRLFEVDRTGVRLRRS